MNRALFGINVSGRPTNEANRTTRSNRFVSFNERFALYETPVRTFDREIEATIARVKAKSKLRSLVYERNSKVRAKRVRRSTREPRNGGQVRIIRKSRDPPRWLPRCTQKNFQSRFPSIMKFLPRAHRSRILYLRISLDTRPDIFKRFLHTYVLTVTYDDNYIFRSTSYFSIENL